MRRWRREPIYQLEDRLFHRAQVLPLVADLGDDFRRLLLHLRQRSVSSFQEVLEHLLLVPEEFLPPDLFILTFGFGLGSVDSHLLKHQVNLLEQGIQLLVPLRRIGLSGFPSGGCRLLTRDGSFLLSSRFLRKRHRGLGAGSRGFRLRGRFGDDFRQFLPVHRRDCARP